MADFDFENSFGEGREIEEETSFINPLDETQEVENVACVG